jgi:hypothetical protein
MKQTAVEWLYNNLKSHFEHDGDLLEVVQFSLEQAKEMEKEQIFDAYITSHISMMTAEQYYYETYESND